MNIQYDEEDRIEESKYFSHCRCKNKVLENGEQACSAFKLLQIKKAKQRCAHINDEGYCRLSKLNEILLIKSTPKSELHLIAHRITTEQGIKFLHNLCGYSSTG